MRILLVSMRMDIGGAETHILELAKELKKRGNFVKVASEGGALVSELEKYNIGHITAPLSSKKPKDIFLSYKTLRKYIKEDKYEIVHSHGRIPNFIIHFLRKKYNFGFVTTLHFSFTKTKFIEQFSLWGEKSLAVSEDLRKHLIKNSHVKPKDVVTTVNGINIKEFNEDNDVSYLYNEFPLKKDSKKIVCVCRMERSNCESMFSLVSQAENINKHLKNVQIILVGDGEAYEELKEKANAVNKKTKDNTVILMGARKDVNNIISICDVFVGISRAALEAMAAGKTVVLTGSYGHHGVLLAKDFEKNMLTNFTCRTLPQITQKAVYKSVCDAYLMDKKDKHYNTAKIKELVEEHFSSEKMCDDAEKVYKELLTEIKSGEIILSGYYGFSNSGDDAILKMIIKAIKSHKPDIGITILSNKPNEAKKLYGVNSVSRWNIFAICKALKNSSLFISGGGSVIQDVTSTKSLYYYLMLITLAKKYKNKVMLYANGIGPVNKVSNRKKTRDVLNKVDVITLREEDSKSFLEELGVLMPKVEVTCDPAIGLEDIPTVEAEDLLFRYDIFREKYILISLREWKTSAFFEEDLKKSVLELKEKYGLKAVFVPLQHPHDVEINKRMAKLTNSICIERRISAEMFIALAMKSEFCISMRLHAIIYSFVAGVPAVGIAYDPKIESVMKYFGEENYIGIFEFTKRSFLAKVQRVVEKNELYREEIKYRLEQLKAKNKINTEYVLKLLEGNNVD